MSRHIIGADGMIHTRPMDGEKPKEWKGNRGILEERRRLEAVVCTRCTAEDCKGTIKCMKKRKKEMEEAGKWEQR